MPTFAMFVLAILSLLAGALFEPPVAKAAYRAKATAPATSEKRGYSIASEDIAPQASRRYVAVNLSKRLPEADLIRIADEVRTMEKAPHEKTIVNFYLPNMKVGQGAWAIATYNPALKLNIVGLRLDEAETAAAEAAADPRNPIGVWLTSPPAAPGRLTLYRSGASLFVERRLRDGSTKSTEVLESRYGKGKRYTPAAGGTDFFILTSSGELELHDGATLIATAERVPGLAVAAAVKPAIVRSRKRAPSARMASRSE